MPSLLSKHLPSAMPLVTAGLLATVAITQSGCLGLASQLMHVAGMNLTPPECDELHDQTVAIVTVTDNSQYTSDTTAQQLSRKLGEVLTLRVNDLELVREDLIAEYRDVHGYDSVDYQELGKEVGADQVLVVELAHLNLRDGMTLFRGRSDVFMRVIDVESGNTVFRKTLDEYTFPQNAGQHSSETTESRFRKLYFTMLSAEIGRSFYSYDPSDRIAQDAKIASFR